MQQSAPARRLVSIVLLSAFCACSQEKSNAQSVKQDQQSDVSQSAATGCDASLWNHVYNPTRLQQLAPCVSVTGTIEESDVDADGDQHFLLKLDPGQDTLVNKRNQKKKGGDIVLEIVCQSHYDEESKISLRRLHESHTHTRGGRARQGNRHLCH